MSHLQLAEKTEEGGSYVVVSGRPGGVELHVKLSLLPGQLVVLGLLLPGQGVPLKTHTLLCFTALHSAVI